MNEKELLEVLCEYRNAIKLVKNHIDSNPTSSDIPMWSNALHKLKKRLNELEECLDLGEYDE